MRNNIRWITYEGYSRNIADQSSLKLKVINGKESLRDCHNQVESEGTLQPKLLWYPKWDPKIEKGYYEESKEIWVKYGL